MRKLSCGIVVLGILLCAAPSARAEVSVAIGLPHVSIGINLPYYPDLVLVPGYPVYYAPRIYANYFFYDGMYWVFHGDHWYASDWYNGPWWLVEPEFVPLFILRIPVRYYLRPPVYFYRWHAHEPPRWGERWGHEWERRRSGWDRWERHAVPAPAPLPVYQRHYSGSRYPRMEQRDLLRNRHYRYQPRDENVREHIRPRIERSVPLPDRRERDDDGRRRSRQPDFRGEDRRDRGEPGLQAPRRPGFEEPGRRSDDVRRERQELERRSREAERRERAPETRGRGDDDRQEPRRDRGEERRRHDD